MNTTALDPLKKGAFSLANNLGKPLAFYWHA